MIQFSYTRVHLHIYLMHHIGRFTSLCKIFTHFSIQQKFSVPCALLQCFAVSPGSPSIDNSVHATEKLMVNTKVSEQLYSELNLPIRYVRPPRWSSGQHVWLLIMRSRVRSPALPQILMWFRSGTGSTQPREDNWVATWLRSGGSD